MEQNDFDKAMKATKHTMNEALALLRKPRSNTTNQHILEECGVAVL